MTTTKLRPIYSIANEIRMDWKKVYFGAVPYLNAMLQLQSIDDNYGMDSAKSVVLYFLSNAGTWRGETAKRIKKELIGEGILTESTWQKIEERVDEEIETAVNFSEKECTIPDPSEILRGVYADS